MMKTQLLQQLAKDVPQGGKGMVRRVLFLVTFIFMICLMSSQGWAANYTISLTPNSATVLESDGTASFNLSITPPLTSVDTVEVSYSTSTGVSDTHTFYNSLSPGLDSKDIVISFSDNTVESGDSLLVFTIDSLAPNGTNTASISGASSASITILDDEYSLSSFSDVSIDEDAGNASLTVVLTRSVALTDSVVIGYSSSDNTASGGSDYTAVSGSFTIPAGSDSGSIVIPIIDDSDVECPEEFSVIIYPPTRVSLAADPADDSAVVIINIDDTYTIDMSNDFSVDVGDGTAVAEVTVLVSPGIAAGDSFQVAYTTVDGTGTSGTDYTAQSGTLTFSSDTVTNPNPQTISIPILNDGSSTGSETFSLTLGAITPSTPACTTVITYSDNSTQVTINDHDFKITAGLDQNLSEDGGNMLFTVVLNRDPVGTEEIEVDYSTANGTATSGSDFTTTSGTLTIDSTDAAGDKIITVPIIDDSIKENAETFALQLSPATGSVNVLIEDDTAIGTIFDDDYEVIGFADISVDENVGTAQLTVMLDRDVESGDSVSLSYSSANVTAIEPGDYSAVSDTLIIPAGSNSGTIDIPILDDSLVELAETFTVTLAPVSNNVDASNFATITIEVDEQYSVTIDDVTMQEADADMTFTVSLTPALQADHAPLEFDISTADGSAVAPDDYTAIVGEVITFSTGETTHTQEVTIKEDTIDEGVSESFTLDLTNSSIPSIVNFTDSSGLGTILDTDYAITPTWNQDGVVTLESPVGSAIAIISGTGVAIVNNTQAEFTVHADFRIHSVLIDGVAPGTLGYITALTPNDTDHTYTFETSTPQGAHTITVLFDHQIGMTATGSGTVSHTTGTGQSVSSGATDLVLADHGEDESFLIEAGSECVTDLLIDGTSQGAFVGSSDNWDDDSYTFSNVTDNHTLEAQFGTAEITVSIGADDGATGTDDDSSIQTEAIWYAYEADGSYNIGSLIKSGEHGESFSLPTDASCDVQYVVIQFLAVDNWTKPNDLHLNLDLDFNDQVVEGLYDRDYFILTITADHGSVEITDTSGNPTGSPYVGDNQYIFAADTDIQLTSVSDPSWYFQLWQQDASGTTSPVTITMDSDKTVEPIFVQSCQDADGDGYTVADLSASGCAESADLDCNDADGDIHPGVNEICGDGIDQDCTGADLTCSGDDSDDDGDGYTENQGDCDDTDTSIAPGLYDDPATPENEDCYDGPKEIGTELTCSQPSDVPVQAARKPAPPLIMFLLDDSGSMDWEFMTSESSQLFSNRYYVYSYDYRQRAYGNDHHLSESQRRMWLSQYAGYNKIFFNPETEYNPWPRWEEVVGATNVRANEIEYAGTGTFPDTAYSSSFTHADMDRPRFNTYDSSSTINAMYHPGGNNTTYDIDLNAEFVSVELGGGQQIMVTRDGSSSGNTTHADAVGLSRNDDLELTVGHTSAWYDSSNRPEHIFDNSDGSVYSESGSWSNSEGNSDYEWQNNDRYTSNSGSSASWKLDLSAGEEDGYYAYVWVDEYGSRDNNALYTIFSYDTAGDLQSQTVRRDQSPTNTSGTTTGAHWIRLNDTAINFIEQNSTTLSIPNAHYYTWYDANGDGDYDDTDEKYLVIIRGSGHTSTSYSLEYYMFFDVNSNDTVEDGELTLTTGADIPSEIIPAKYDVSGDQITDSDELAYVVRQDFADWFSFYRRRILTAKSGVGQTVVDMWDLKLGLHTINRTYTEPLVYMDEDLDTGKLNLLQTLYNIRPAGSTYLRRGLDDVGRYFQEGDSIVVGGSTYNDYSGLETSDGLDPATCSDTSSSDNSVFYDSDTDYDTDTCDDAGGECQRAYVIAMTDGYYNDGYSSTRIGNADGSSSYSIMQDGASNSLADFSYYYYNTDLDTTLDDGVPSKGFDDATHQKLVTYMVSFGVFGYFDPEDFTDCLPTCDTPGSDGCPSLAELTAKTWTESGGAAVFSGIFDDTCPDWHNSIFQSNPKSIDDLYHASINGRGKFYNAADPGELVDSLQNIKQLIDSVTGTAASVSVNARKIEDDTLLFQTTYDSSDWSGDVLAKCLDSTGEVVSCLKASCEASCSASYDSCTSICAIGDVDCEAVCETALENCYTTNSCDDYGTCDDDKDTCDDDCSGDLSCLNACSTAEETCSENPPEEKWSASNQLATATYDTRQIITSTPDTTSTAGVAGVPFRWSNLPASMQTSLNNQEDMLNYLRGDATYERRNDSSSVHNYRNRTATVLGDFINAEPYHYEDTTIGIDWVFVGGNDGMLHCFDGQTGVELFAYIPNVVFSNLANLADEGYSDNHKFFVDGYMEIVDLGSKIILVGGLGKGGKGYYALDLTAAASNIGAIETNAADIVLWEYTDITQTASADDLGYSFSRPWIGPSNDTSSHRLFVFGNGYDSTNGHAVLFTVGLAADGSIQWTTSIDTGIGDASSDCNGLSSPAILYPQGDGVDDYNYAGDLLGNMWKFDLSAADRSSWEIYFTDGADPQPLFSAKSNAGYRQPITMQPDVTTSCATGVSGYLVAFGTGRLLDPDVDTYDTSVQTAYGIWDWSAAWEEEGVAPESTYLGSFESESSPPTAACTSSCADVLGDATTSGTCVYECFGNAECIEECEEVYESCATNCSAVRNLSNMSTIIASGSSNYVALLRQTQVWGGGINYNSDGSISEQQYGATNSEAYDEISRVLSDNEIDWLLPSEKATFEVDTNKNIKHVGWYFDLPANGERIIRDVSILNSKLIYTTSIPSDSPCESGGISNYFAVDVCTGGRLDSAFFDINADGVIDSNDYINIGTEADPIYVAPSSIQVESLAPAPTAVEVEDTDDKLYFTENIDGDEEVSGMVIEGWGKALQYWRELDWN